MEIQGKIIVVLPERGGTSQRGTEWKAQEYVIETHDKYPRKMVFELFGSERIEHFNIQIGQEVIVSFDVDAREWNGRWFNSIRAYNVQQVAAVAPVDSNITPAVSAPPVVDGGAAPITTSDPTQADADKEDELPF